MGQTNIKPIKGKFLTKHQTAAEWDLCNDGAGAQYIPDLGELVIYDPDESYQFVRLKFGDGEKIVKELPFAFEEKLSSSDIVNTLTSEAVEYPLSAAQGKELKRLLDELAQSTVQSINSLQDTKIGVSDVVDSLDSTEKNKPLSANQGRLLKENFGNYVTETELKEAIDAIPTPDVSGQINQHNINSAAHDDIRALISKLRKDLDTLANSDDVNLDQLSEIVAYIKSNKALIEAITTSKVNVSDIIDNLTTNASDKPLSAAQGVALKALIDAIVIPNYEPAGTEFGLMKTGGDLTITNGIATVNDNSHGHIISNIGGLQEALDGRTVVGEEVLDNNIAYIKEVPAKSAPYARIDAVGGMTRKCTNLIPYPYENTTQTKNGVAFTDNGDGTITVNGTATGDTYFVLKAFTLNKGNYILSGCPSGGAFDKHMLYLEKGVSANDFGNSASFTLAESADIQAVIRIYTNQTVSNLTFKPMLNSGSTALPYEPYFEGLRSASVESVESVGVQLFDKSKVAGATETDTGIKFTNKGNTMEPTGIGTFAKLVPQAKVGDVITFYADIVNGAHAKGLLYCRKDWIKGSFITVTEDMLNAPVYAYGVSGTECEYKNLIITKIANAPYSPYQYNTLPIPAEVRAKPWYGLGVSKEVCNAIRYNEDGSRSGDVRCGVVDMGAIQWSETNFPNTFRSGVRNLKPPDTAIERSAGFIISKYPPSSNVDYTNIDDKYAIRYQENILVRDSDYSDAAAFKAAMSGVMLVYELATPTTEDISDILPADNYIGVEGGGTLTFVNEYGYDVPSEVTWYENSNDVIGAEEFVGDLIGTAVRAISDKNGNDITETYVTKDDLVDLGSGDMLKSVYDTDGDGVVDNAEKLGGVAAADYAKKSDIPPAITVDSALSSTSTNPVQNKVINSALASKAAASDLTSHTGNTTAHITSTERSNWNAAKTHADSAHAPSNAEKNQNAFSNITVGSTTVAADSATDTVTFVGSNVTITPDATNDKITFAVADGSTSAKGIVQLTNSTSSTSTTTAATPSSVKSAYDLANTANTSAATAQTKADSAYTLAESKVDSLSDLGITATATELNYVDGVTSNIQTQLDSKLNTSSVSGGTYVGDLNNAPIGVSWVACANCSNTPISSGYGYLEVWGGAQRFTVYNTGEVYYRCYVNSAWLNWKQIDSLTDVSNLQTSKQATITGAATTITGSNLTASRALISNSSGKVAVSDITSTELGYLDGVTSNIQTQLNGKVLKRTSDGTSYTGLGTYYASGSTAKYVKISFPSVPTWTMATMELTIRENYGSKYSGKLLIYANQSSGANWNISAVADGTLTTAIKVYGSDKQHIYIEGISSWGGLSLDRMLIGDAATSSDLTAMTLTGVDSLPTTYQTATMYYGIHSGNIGSQSVASATKATQDASGNTITSTYATKKELSGKANSSHTHTKSQIIDFPSIPIVNNATLTIQKNGTNVATFTANSATNATANITVPTGAAADKGVDTSISAGSTSTNLPTSKAVAAFVEGKGYTTNTGDITAVVAGNGLTGGATSGSATLNVGAGTGITVNADTIEVKYGTSAGTAAEGNHSHDLSTMINGLSEGTSAPTDTDFYVSQYAGGGTTTKSYRRRPMSALWSYIKGKTDGLYQAKGSYAADNHGTHVPTPQTANNAKFLRNDNTWQTVTPANIGAAASSHTHTLADAGITYGTSDLTAGSSALTTGTLYFVYE